MRSYSTTALPVGALIHLHQQEKRERKTICSFHPSAADTSSVGSSTHRIEEEAEERPGPSDKQSDDQKGSLMSVPSPARSFSKQCAMRLNLTSDYDSSCESPSGGSDAAADDATLETSSSRTRKSIPAIGKIDEEPATLATEKVSRCILCGNTLRSGVHGQVAQALEPSWPNVPPPTLLEANLDEKGRYVIDGITYDLEALGELFARITFRRWLCNAYALLHVACFHD